MTRATLPDMDSDEPVDPTDTQAQPAPVADTPAEQSEVAPAEDEAAGATPISRSTTDWSSLGPALVPVEPDAIDTARYDDALVGDWATPDVDLDGLIPTDDGDPDDDEASG